MDWNVKTIEVPKLGGGCYIFNTDTLHDDFIELSYKIETEMKSAGYINDSIREDTQRFILMSKILTAKAKEYGN